MYSYYLIFYCAVCNHAIIIWHDYPWHQNSSSRCFMHDPTSSFSLWSLISFILKLMSDGHWLLFQLIKRFVFVVVVSPPPPHTVFSFFSKAYQCPCVSAFHYYCTNSQLVLWNDVHFFFNKHSITQQQQQLIFFFPPKCYAHTHTHRVTVCWLSSSSSFIFFLLMFAVYVASPSSSSSSSSYSDYLNNLLQRRRRRVDLIDRHRRRFVYRTAPSKCV